MWCWVTKISNSSKNNYKKKSILDMALNILLYFPPFVVSDREFRYHGQKIPMNCKPLASTSPMWAETTHRGASTASSSTSPGEGKLHAANFFFYTQWYKPRTLCFVVALWALFLTRGSAGVHPHLCCLINLQFQCANPNDRAPTSSCTQNCLISCQVPPQSEARGWERMASHVAAACAVENTQPSRNIPRKHSVF